LVGASGLFVQIARQKPPCLPQRVMRDDSRLDHDLATLVRSATKPGLADRIRAFAATQVKK